MQKVLKKSRRTSSTQLPRSSPKKSLRSWRCVEQILLLVFLSFLFSIRRWWGWPAIWKKNCDACCEWFCNSYWYYLFHKKILKYTYFRNLCCNISWSSPIVLSLLSRLVLILGNHHYDFQSFDDKWGTSFEFWRTPMLKGLKKRAFTTLYIS